MSQDDLAERLDAVERRLDAAYPDPADGPTDTDTAEHVESLAERLADLEAAVEAVEGYVGEIERVDEELEQRADAALATADGLGARVESIEERLDTLPDPTGCSLDDRLAEQTAALEDLRAEVGSLDDRLSAVEPDAGVDEHAAEHDVEHATESHANRCTCGRTEPSGIDDAAETGARRSAADGGFERPDPHRGGVNATAASPTDAGHANDDRSHEPPADGLGAESTTPTEQGAVSGVDRTPAEAPPNPGFGRGSDGQESHGAKSTGQQPIRQQSAEQRSAGTEPQRRAQTGPSRAREGTTVSGWSESGPAAERSTERPPADPSTPAGSGTTPAEDRSWTDANSETLLDRLRSML